MQLLRLGLGRHLGPLPVGLVSRACPTSLSLGILETWPNYPGCVLAIRSGWTIETLRISQLRTLSRSVTPGA